MDSTVRASIQDVLKELGQADAAGRANEAFIQALFDFRDQYTTEAGNLAAEIQDNDNEEVREFCYNFLSEECGNNGDKFWGPGQSSAGGSALCYPENFERIGYLIGLLLCAFNRSPDLLSARGSPAVPAGSSDIAKRSADTKIRPSVLSEAAAGSPGADQVETQPTRRSARARKQASSAAGMVPWAQIDVSNGFTQKPKAVRSKA